MNRRAAADPLRSIMLDPVQPHRPRLPTPTRLHQNSSLCTICYQTMFCLLCTLCSWTLWCSTNMMIYTEMEKGSMLLDSVQMHNPRLPTSTRLCSLHYAQYDARHCFALCIMHNIQVEIMII